MSDTGHERLIGDLSSIFKEAQSYEFHDFKNEKYATPKVALVKQLESIIKQVKNGWYDNEVE